MTTRTRCCVVVTLLVLVLVPFATAFAAAPVQDGAGLWTEVLDWLFAGWSAGAADHGLGSIGAPAGGASDPLGSIAAPAGPAWDPLGQNGEGLSGGDGGTTTELTTETEVGSQVDPLGLKGADGITP